MLLPLALKEKEELNKELTLIIVYDNKVYKRGLRNGWGFSCFIKTKNYSLLFDTGADPKTLLLNMKDLKINPLDLDSIFISHEHLDHTGGFSAILKLNPNLKVFIPKSASVEIPEKNVIRIEKFTPIYENIYSTGELGGFVKEQSLVVNTSKGLVIITGCAHPGILNIVKKVKENLKDKIYLVIGGFHLFGEDEETIKEIANEMFNLTYLICPCHCSGDLAEKVFRGIFKKRFLECGVGREINV